MHPGAIVLSVLLLAPAWSGSPYAMASVQEELQEQLEHAAELNVTAPWPESQAILDEIKPLLDHATPDQYATYQNLRIRNLALNGHLSTALERIEDLLDHEMPEHQRLNTLLRGANLAMNARRFEMAFDYLNRSLDLESRVDHADLPTDVYSLAADMLKGVGKYKDAIAHGEMAVEVARKRGDARPECIARMGLSDAYLASDETDAAMQSYRHTLESCRQANDPVFVATAEFGLGDTLRKAGRLDQAEPLLQSALAGHLESDYVIGAAETRLSLARLHLERGRFEAARELLPSLVTHFAEFERWDELAEAHRLLEELAVHNGDYEQALDEVRAQMAARERFLDMDRARRVAYLEAEFDTRVKEQRMALLREEARVRELEVESRQHRRRLSTLGYIATGLLVVILMLLLTHASRERRRYRRLSYRDGLTGLNNHTRFFELAEPAFRASREGEEPFTLILADIDLFKHVNDGHGHQTGDATLRRVGARLRENFSRIGIIGRVGGEEFAIALPGHRMADIREPLEMLREKLKRTRRDDDSIPVTMSYGVAEANGESSLTELRRRADKALYKAKEAGRDRAVFVDNPD